VPTSIAGLLMLVVLAFPGYLYHRVADRRLPERAYTAFQELLSVLFVSLVVDLVTLALLKLVALTGWWPSPGLRALALTPHGYAVGHFTVVVAWSAAALLTASALAYALGAGWWRRLLRPAWARRWDERATRLESQKSAWWLLFHEHPDADMYVGCVLEDGSYLAGTLHSYSRVPDEHGDRELTLRGDILYRAPGDDTAAVLPQVNAVAVSARRLTFLTVSYLTPTPPVVVPPAASPPVVVPPAAVPPTGGSPSTQGP